VALVPARADPRGGTRLAAVALVAFALVAGGFAWYRERANRELGERAIALTEALGTVTTERNHAVAAEEKARAEERTTRQLTAGLALDRGRAAWQAGEPGQGLLWMTRSLTLAPDDDTALQEAIRINLAGWRATVPPPAPSLQHPGVVARAAFTPDGTRLVALSTGKLSREERTMPDGTTGTFLVYCPETPGDDPFLSGAGAIPTVGNLLDPRRRLAAARGRVLIWDVATGKPVDVKPPPDGQVLAVTADGKIALAAKRQDQILAISVQLWDLMRGEPVGETAKLNESIHWAAASGDGKTFATISDASLGGPWLTLWDAQTGRRTDFPLRFAPSAVSLSPDGTVLAVVTADGLRGGPKNARSGLPTIPGMPRAGPPGHIKLYDLAAREQLPARPGAGPRGEVDSEAAVALGPGARSVLMVGPSDTLRAGPVVLWDRETNKQLRLPAAGRPTLAQFSPDGKVLLTAGVGGESVVQLWDTATGQPRGAPLLPRGAVQTAAFSPDSKLLAIAGNEGEVQLWETATGRPLARALRHPGPIHAVAFSPDGTKLVTGGHDGLARVWNTHPSRAVPPLRSLERVAVITADGSRCLVRDEGDALRLYDTASGQPCGESLPLPRGARGVALGPDGRTLAISGPGNTARLWDAVTAKPISEPLSHVGPVTGSRFTPDGRTLLTFVASTIPPAQAPIVYRWDAASGRTLDFERNPDVLTALALSPDGRRALRAFSNSTEGLLFSGGWGLKDQSFVAMIADISQARGETKSLAHPGPIVGGLFSPDSRTLLTVATRSGAWEEARLWEVATGKPLGPPMPHQGPIRALVFRADGKMVLTGSDDGTARLWDAAAGKPLGPLLSHGGRVRAVTFSPDGKLAATGGDDGTARLWHVATGQSLGPPLPHPAAVSFVAFVAGGELLITAAGDRVRAWQVPAAMPGEAKRLLLEAEVETGMELDGSTTRLLEDVERMQRVQQMEEHLGVKSVEGKPLPN
jgi:WD40 repeat protein